MTAEQPAYVVGMFPWMAEWWLNHLDAVPVVVIRCGRGEPWCKNSIGEVKADDGRVLAMSRNEHPEVTTDWQPLAAPTVEELAAEIAERDAQALRYTGTGPGDGSIVYKRTALPREVAPVEDMTYYVCREHGEVEVNPAELVAFVCDTMNTGRTKRTFWSGRAID